MKPSVVPSFLLALIPAVALAAGSASPAKEGAATKGTFAANGQTAKIAFAAAFTDQQEDAKPVILVLSDKPLPVDSWKSGSDLSAYRREHPFLGVAFWLDKDNKVARTEYYDGTSFPTSASGLFEVKVERAGKTLTGSASSNAAAAKLSSPVRLEASFKASLMN